MPPQSSAIVLQGIALVALPVRSPLIKRMGKSCSSDLMFSTPVLSKLPYTSDKQLQSTKQITVAWEERKEARLLLGSLELLVNNTNNSCPGATASK